MGLPAFPDHDAAKAGSGIPGQPGPTRNVAAVILGRRLLNKMLGPRQLSLSGLPRESLAHLMARHGARTLEDLYEDIGTGKLPASTVVRSLLQGW